MSEGNNEHWVPVQMWIVKKYCNCGGELIADNTGRLSLITSGVEHVCEECGEKAVFDIAYPELRYQEE